MSFAFYTNRYTIRIYPVSASIIIREREETTGAELLYKNSLSDQYRNYLNEPYIIRSLPLIQRVIEDLNFAVSFYSEGYVRTSEAYESFPFKVTYIRSVGPENGKSIFNLLSENSYSLETSGAEGSQRKEFSLGDTIVFGGKKLLIEKVPHRSFFSRCFQ